MELLIRIKDSYPVTGTATFDCKVTRRGDVIDIHEDGHAWSQMELSLPFWRVLKLPNVSLAMAQSLMSPEPYTASMMAPDGSVLAAQDTTQFRGFKFNVDHPSLPADLKAYLADDTRAAGSFTSLMTDNDISTPPFKLKKAAWSTATAQSTTT